MKPDIVCFFLLDIKMVEYDASIFLLLIFVFDHLR